MRLYAKNCSERVTICLTKIKLGRAGVIFGSQKAFSSQLNWDDLDGTTGFRISYISNAHKREFGSDATKLGDVNEDGFDDFAVTQSSSKTGSYAAFVFLGRPKFNGDEYVQNCNGEQCFAIYYRYDNIFIVVNPLLKFSCCLEPKHLSS